MGDTNARYTKVEANEFIISHLAYSLKILLLSLCFCTKILYRANSLKLRYQWPLGFHQDTRVLFLTWSTMHTSSLPSWANPASALSQLPAASIEDLITLGKRLMFLDSVKILGHCKYIIQQIRFHSVMLIKQFFQSPSLSLSFPPPRPRQPEDTFSYLSSLGVLLLYWNQINPFLYSLKIFTIFMLSLSFSLSL